MEPVCSGLQAQILRCYREHLQEVLLCADLVKAYQHCVGSAHKVGVSCSLPPALGSAGVGGEGVCGRRQARSESSSG